MHEWNAKCNADVSEDVDYAKNDVDDKGASDDEED